MGNIFRKQKQSPLTIPLINLGCEQNVEECITYLNTRIDDLYNKYDIHEDSRKDQNTNIYKINEQINSIIKDLQILLKNDKILNNELQQIKKKIAEQTCDIYIDN